LQQKSRASQDVRLFISRKAKEGLINLVSIIPVKANCVCRIANANAEGGA